MASPPQQGGPGLGAFAMSGARFALKAALNVVLANRPLIDHIASRMYEDEVMKSDWSKKSPADRAIWHQRVQSAIVALSGTLGI